MNWIFWLGLASLLPALLVNGLAASSSYQVEGIACHPVRLQQKDDNSPFCLAASSAMDLMQHCTGSDPPVNFLASQVWPSARVAAFALQKHMKQNANKKNNDNWRVCEFGCGPGLPSLTAAKLGAPKVIATDLDLFALKLVERASQEQGLQDCVETQQFDLLQANLRMDDIPEADLYLFSDIFESSQVALGAAEVSRLVLSNNNNINNNKAKIWVFAQSDRACREDYLKEMRAILKDPSLNWAPLDDYDASSNQQLFLCDLDETKVTY